MTMRSSLNFTGSLLLACAGLLVANTAGAAPGVLANEPLQTAATAPPNILLHLDTSGSMQHIAPGDIGSYTFTCSNSNAIIDGYDPSDASDSGEDWSWQITGSGSSSYPEIYTDADDEWRDFGNTGSTYCFNPNHNYYATLEVGLGGAGGSVLYTGEYLNWYFNTSTDASGNWDDNDHKPGAQSRIEVAQDALVGLVNSLNNINVGLTTFDGGSGADLVDPIDDVGDSGHLGDLVTNINATVASGSTPLAEATRDIGRYFANNDSGQCGGSASADLTIHPDDALVADGGRREDVDCSTLLYSRITTAGPIEYYCQKNFSIMMTDGVPTSDTNIHSDLKDYRDSDSDYWDDVTKALFEIDLRPDIDDPDGSEVVNNISTFTIGFADESVKNSDLIRQAAEDAGGQFIFAESASDLRRALEAAAFWVEENTGTSSAVTFNSSTLSSQSAVYQALFNTLRWSGELRSIPLDGFTGEVLTGCVNEDPVPARCWKASEKLDGQNPDSRVILTYHPGETEGRPFRAPADYQSLATDEVPQELIDDLCASGDMPYDCSTTTAAEITANQAYIEAMIDFHRGDRDNEGTGFDFRTRTVVLGDLVNASPVYVSKPASGWPNQAPFPLVPDDVADPDNSYGKWARSSIKDRDAVVYAASNDGMLHGFDADTGNEVFAFLPSGTFSTDTDAGLHYLADNTYRHRYYNDLTPTIQDVYINHRDGSGGTMTTSEEWRTVLVGGQRQGGRFLYMLDVTDPSEFSENDAEQLVEWEFSHDDLGYSFSKPTIAMMNNGRFAAIFGNGYKSGEDGGSGDCRAKLFIVYLDGGQDGTWSTTTPDPDYQVIDTGVGNAGDCNGLSTPAIVDLNRDGAADKVYAGDLYGNLWAFDLCNYDGSTEACQDSGWGLADSDPIMTATGGSPATRQPITVKPVVSRDPSSSGADDLIIAFGTGQYVTTADIDDTSVQSIYAVREYTALQNGGNYGLDPRKNNAKFIEQEITQYNDCSGVVTDCEGALRFITQPVNSISKNDNGWFIDLPTSGERVVVNPAIRSGVLFINSMIPSKTVCESGGDGWIMSINLENGGPPNKPIFDINNDGVINGGDTLNNDPPIAAKIEDIPAESTFLGDKQYTPDSEGNINVRDVNIGKSRREGRMSWRELIPE